MEAPPDHGRSAHAGLSMLRPLDENSSPCGYCGSKDQTSVSSYMLAASLSVVDYQALIDRGWRRSGKLLYLPAKSKTCCPQHTIRLKVKNYVASPAQAKLARKAEAVRRPAAKRRHVVVKPSPEVEALKEAVDAWIGTVLADCWCGSGVAQLGQAKLCCRPLYNAKGSWAFDCCLPVALAAALRKDSTQEGAPSPQSICEAFQAKASTLPIGISLASPSANAWHLRFNSSLSCAEHCLQQPPSTESAADEATNESEAKLHLSDMTMRMVPARFDADSFALYVKYQQAVHGDKAEDLTQKQYKRFLVESPLVPVPACGPQLPHAAATAALDSSRQAALQSATQQAASAASKLQALIPTIAQKLHTSERLVEQLLVAMGCSAKRVLTAAVPLAHVLSSLPHTAHAELLSSQLGVTLDPDATLQQALEVACITPPSAGEYLHTALASVAASWRDGEGAGAGLPLTAGGDSQPVPPAAAAAAGGQSCSAGGTAVHSASRPTGVAQGGAPEGSDLSMGYGSFHQKYYCGDRLVAVGVVDILPHCLSSVYLFYDPTLPQLSLGKFTALREIQWVRAASCVAPRLQYYYMGFYVASCHKMRYKGDYAPSELLCPLSLRWVPLAPLAERLKREAYFNFAQHAAQALSVPEDSFPQADTWIPSHNLQCARLEAAGTLFLLAPRGVEGRELQQALAAAPWAEQALCAGQLQPPGNQIILRLLAQIIQGTGPDLASRLCWFV